MEFRRQLFMSPGFLSDKRAVVAIIIGAILAIVAYVFVRPIDRTISYVVFGVAAILFVYAWIMDVADEFEPAAKPKPKPKVKPVPEPEPAEEHAEEYVPDVEAPAAELSKLPIETIEGIGEVYGKELKAAGVKFHYFSPQAEKNYLKGGHMAAEAWWNKWDSKGKHTKAAFEKFMGYVEKYEKELKEKGYPWQR